MRACMRRAHVQYIRKAWMAAASGRVWVLKLCFWFRSVTGHKVATASVEEAACRLDQHMWSVLSVKAFLYTSSCMAA